MESMFENINGLPMHARHAGPPSGPVALLLHGFPEFWYGWRRQIPALVEAGYHVVAPDQRGYNLSAKPEGVREYAIGKLVSDVTGWMDALGQTQVYLIGHDWGAAVAWETAMRHPERVKRLAILNVPHPEVMMRSLRRTPSQLFKSWYIFFFQAPRLGEAVLRANRFAAMQRMLVNSGRRDTFSEADLATYVQAWAQPGALTGMLNWYRAALRYNYRGPWNPRHAPRRVKPPTLILWGKRDIALSEKLAQPSLEQCEDGRLVFFEQATHWVQHDAAEQVNRELVEFGYAL